MGKLAPASDEPIFNGPCLWSSLLVGNLVAQHLNKLSMHALQLAAWLLPSPAKTDFSFHTAYLPSSQAVRFHWLSTGTQPPEIASREGFAFAIAKSICPWVGFVGISTNSTWVASDEGRTGSFSQDTHASIATKAHVPYDTNRRIQNFDHIIIDWASAIFVYVGSESFFSTTVQ